MKRILLVDDEKPFLLSLRDGLQALDNDYTLLLASDGQEALHALKNGTVDLLVTDLKLPIMDGFQLLAHASRLFPDLPVIVMTAFGTPEIEERLTKLNESLHYLEKPLDIDLLAATIGKALESDSRSYIRGITLATFLQLVHMEQKTCSLKVRSGKQVGYLFVRQGELLDAEAGEVKGEEAALQIVAWEKTEIEMDNICRRKEKKIDSSLEFILMEAFRLKDELAQSEAEAAAEAKEESSSAEATPAARAQAEDPLAIALRGSPEVDEFAIFDNRNFLEHHSDLPCSITHLDPAYYLAVSRKMNGLFDCGELNYLLIQTNDRQRTMFFQHQDQRVVLNLTSQAKPRNVIGALKKISLNR